MIKVLLSGEEQMLDVVIQSFPIFMNTTFLITDLYEDSIHLTTCNSQLGIWPTSLSIQSHLY